VAKADKIAIHIGLHDLSGLRWPKEPVSGTGPRRPTTVPLPRLPWATTAIEVPLGESAAGDIARVLTLRKAYGYVVAPIVIALFVIADVLLLWVHYGSLHPPGPLFLWLGLAGVVLVLTGLLPDVVARFTGTPYVSRNRLRLPAARTEVVKQLAKLNPQVEIGGLPTGDLPSRR
jgi:hypothetical protein